MIIKNMRVHYENRTLKKTWQPSTDKKDKKAFALLKIGYCRVNKKL